MNRFSRQLVLMTLIAGAGMVASAQETNKPTGTLDYNSFKIITERNIFNASRSGRRSRTVVKRTPKVDTFTLRGTLSYEQGQHAIFDNGSRQSDLKLGAEINGYRVSQITFNYVMLTPAKGDPIKLSVGMQMRREDEGPWTLGGRSDSSTASATTTSTASSSSTDKPAETSAPASDDDIVRRLMEKRKQKLKQ